ncbi:hypothetical protein ABZ837_37685 [Streptomyces sp. NPDC047197]|uniref:hypothetical protein n=1 Tax=Streptomyces sp. NPDC047197 TaxID=3155477 RepID=UPI0033ECB7F8
MQYEASRTGKLNNAELQKYARDKAASGVVVTLAWYEQQGLEVDSEPRIAPRVNSVALHGKSKTAVLSGCLANRASDTVYETTGKSALYKGSEEPDRGPVTARAVSVGDRWLNGEYTIDRTRPC